MPKKLTTAIISKINSGHLVMRPRSYFILGSLLSAFGLLVSGIALVFSLYLLHFALTHPGVGAQAKLSLILSNLPWYIPILALASLFAGLMLLRRYDFSYKKHFGLILAGLALALVLGVYLLNRSPLAEFLSRRGYFGRRQLQNQQYDPSLRPTPPIRGRFHPN